MMQELVHATARGDADKVVALFSLAHVPEGQAPQIKEQVKEAVGRASAQIKALGGIKRVDIVELTLAEDDQIANLRATLVFGNGGEDTSRVRLRREDGQWKVIMATGLGL